MSFFKYFFCAFMPLIDRTVEREWQEMGGGGGETQDRAARRVLRIGAACSEDYSLNTWGGCSTNWDKHRPRIYIISIVFPCRALLSYTHTNTSIWSLIWLLCWQLPQSLTGKEGVSLWLCFLKTASCWTLVSLLHAGTHTHVCASAHGQ